MKLFARITATGAVGAVVGLMMMSFVANVSHMHYGFGLHALNAVLIVFAISAVAGFAVGKRAAKGDTK